jgi:hypothetical protein
VKTESRRWKRTDSGQLDRRTFIASGGATPCVLASPIRPAKIESNRDCIIVSPNGPDDTPGNLRPLRSLDLALALSQSRERHGRFAVRAASLAMKRGFSNFPIHECRLRSWRLRALARTPDIAPPAASPTRLHGEGRPRVKAKKQYGMFILYRLCSPLNA